MFGSLQLLGHHFDLDAAWVAAQEFDLVTDEETERPDSLRCHRVDWHTYLAWFAPLVKHSLDSGATALHLLRDREENCLRQSDRWPILCESKGWGCDDRVDEDIRQCHDLYHSAAVWLTIA